MIGRISEERKKDPSAIRQSFNDVSIKLFCCRYWLLEEWDCMDLSVPFWRLYHNTLPGAKISFQGKVMSLDRSQVILIPPHTSFSTHLKHNNLSNHNESIIGRRLEINDDLKALRLQGMTDHLFIHFNLGFPFDFVKPGIYTLKCDGNISNLIEKIKASCFEEKSVFDFTGSLRIKQLVIQVLLELPWDSWKSDKIDHRIFDAIKYIEKHLHEKISNDELADKASMAVNSFARLFKITTGTAIRQYILKARIEKSCNFMHHSNKTIDEIARECGFSDSHHFSKAFKQIMAITPAYYKKHLIMT